MAGSTPSQGIPYAERPDAFQLTADLRGSFNKIDSVFAQTRGESVAALSSATAAQVAAGQALARVNTIEDPIHEGPSEPTGGEALWLDTDADAPPSPGGAVTSADITDATDLGRRLLTSPWSTDARNALSIFTGTRALLDAGTDTAERTWDAKELHEYIADNAGGAASWDNLEDRPSTFPPSTHTHDDRYYTEAEVDAKIAAAVAGLSYTTGWRIITPDAGVTGVIKVKRAGGGGGDRTTIRLEGVLPPAGSGSVFLATLPLGFRHTGEHWLIADGRAAERWSELGLYNASRLAWVQAADGSVTRPTDPISCEYTWESPDARPTTLPPSAEEPRMDMYRDWSDEKLDEHRRAIIGEQERRANQALIPEQIAAMARTYRDGGGDEQALTDALTPEEVAELTA